MIIHITTPELLVIELEECDERCEEAARQGVINVLSDSAMEPWSSVEIEMFSFGVRCLVFAVPIKLYIPEIMTRFLNA